MTNCPCAPNRAKKMAVLVPISILHDKRGVMTISISKWQIGIQKTVFDKILKETFKKYFEHF